MPKKSLTQSSSYLLVAHGSSDLRQQLALIQLVKLLRQLLAINAIPEPKNYLEKPKNALVKSLELPLVDSTCLEFTSVALFQSIENFAQKSQQIGYQNIKLLPLFLLSGVHLKEDLPTQVIKARKNLSPKINLELGSHLGSCPGMLSLLEQKFETTESGTEDGRILVAHGSKRKEANDSVESLGTKLQAMVAFWSTPPTLTNRIERLVREGKQKICILPYFLFPGRITDAIATQVAQLQQVFPQVDLILAPPLGGTVELANLILEEMAK